MKQYHITIMGVRALLMHNGMLADPIDPRARRIKAITSIQSSKRSDEDHEALARAEFDGGLYMNADGPYLQAEAVLAGLMSVAGSVKKNLGSAVSGGVLVEEPEIKLLYDGPRTADGLWAALKPSGQRRFVDRRIVNLSPGARSGGKGPRTRPRFDIPWSAEFAISVVDGLGIGFSEIEKLLAAFGMMRGIGDGKRIGFGRFTSTVRK